MSAQSTTLPELAEAEATGAIAEIYEEMRHQTGAPMVALIWRHLATRPGVLEAVWQGIGPLYRAGDLQTAAWRCAAETIVAPPADLGRGKLAAAGFDDAARARFVHVLDAYNRVNPVNFVAVQLIRQSLSAAPSISSTKLGPVHTAWSPPPPIRDIPAMVPIADIEPQTRALIDALSTDRTFDRATVVPTLYRHLTGWPQLIPAMHQALQPRFDSGEMSALVATLARVMTAEANALASAMGLIPQSQAVRAIVPTLERFSSLIPEMVVVGTLLRRGADTA